MLNSSGQRMYDVLNRTGLYSMADNSSAYGEIYAVSCEIELLMDELDEILREMFAQTAQTYGISEREAQWGRVKENLSLNQRRELILNRYKLRTDCPTPARVTQMMAALGFSGSVTENHSACRIDVSVNDNGYTDGQKSEITAALKGIIPAWCSVNVTFA